MLVRVLSQGPSLEQHLPLELLPGAVDIGVNFAVEKHPSHWWVMRDPCPFREAKPVGKPTLFQMRPFSDSDLGPHFFPIWQDWPKKFANEVWPSVPECTTEGVPCYEHQIPGFGPGHKPRTMNFAGLLALMLAWWLKPAKLYLYGYDHAGPGHAFASDHPGVPRNTNPDRWKMEGPVFEWWMEQFKGAAIEVVRP